MYLNEAKMIKMIKSIVPNISSTNKKTERINIIKLPKAVTIILHSFPLTF